MHTYTFPGGGLGFDTNILGVGLGQVYPAGTVFPLCKIYGVLLGADGEPVGSAGQTLINSINDTGGLSLVDTWNGVTVTASISAAGALSGNVIGLDSVSTTTNSFGYFELYVLQDFVYSVSCGLFGKTLTINTTGLSTKDISSYF